MPFQKLSPDARRVRTIMISLPLIGVTSCAILISSEWPYPDAIVFVVVLYKRLVWGEPQRRLPGPDAQGPLISMKTTLPKSGEQTLKDDNQSKEPS